MFELSCNLEEKDGYYLRIFLNLFGGASGVIVIAVGNEHGDTSSNPGRD